MEKQAVVRINFSHQWKNATVGAVGQIINTKGGYFKLQKNGREVWGWKMLEEPRLFAYAEQMGQIITIPREALCIEDRTNEKDIILRRYLLLQMGRIRGTGGKGKILIDSIIQTLPAEKGADKWKRRRLVQKIAATFAAWKKLGTISDWTPIKNGRTVRGWTLTVPENTEQPGT